MPCLCESCVNRIFPETKQVPSGSNIKCEEHFWTFQTNKCKQYISKEKYESFVIWQISECEKCKSADKKDCYKKKINLYDFKYGNLDIESKCTMRE